MKRRTNRRNRIVVRTATLLLVFAVAFTAVPMMTASFTVNAKAKKKLPKKITLTAYGTGQNTAYLTWNKIRKPLKGYAVFRDGICIARLSKKKNYYTDSGLAAGSSHTYQIKVWKKKGKKKYKYSKKSNTVKIQTAARPAPTPTPSGGGDAPTQYKTVTDYLGVERNISSLNANWGKPIFDRTIDGSWDSFIQKSSITFEISGATVYLYNGDLNKVIIDITEPTEVVNTRTFWQGDQYKKTRYFVKSADNKYRLAESGKGFVEITPSSGSGTYTGRVQIGYTDSPHGCGFVNADIHYTIGYDFNGDGDAADSGETLALTKTTVTADKDRLASISICQTAVDAAGTDSYDADMQAISNFITTNYEYGKKVDGTTLMMRCVDGAYILETWSIYKYGVYGYIAPYASPTSDDVDFWPENNPYSSIANWHAQGHH